jgi:hypothetical protein
MAGKIKMSWPAGIALGLGAVASAVSAKEYSDWGGTVSVEDPVAFPDSSSEVNSSAGDGCPILDPYTKDLYMASIRPGGHGGQDIWIAHWNGNGWDTPVNAGDNINTDADEFCPSPARGNRFFFVRGHLPSGNTDIYVSKRNPKSGFGPASPLPAGDDAINSPQQEWSPSWFEAPDGREFLYFSSTRSGRQRIYYSVNFGNAQLAPGAVNSSADDARPNVRHDGLEIVWDSTRFGTLGGPDIWTASRSSVYDPWGDATHLDAPINSPAGESRASLSWDGTMLMFGSTRAGEGGSDIYRSTRSKVTGQ